MDANAAQTTDADLFPNAAADQLENVPTEIAFGRYVALPSARALLLDGNAVCLGARAFDLLVLLLTSRGTIVSKETIMRHVWPTTTVDESNLRFQMACLRRAIGEERERIKTITGRGYLFVPEKSKAGARAASWAERAQAPPQAAPKPSIVIIDGDPDNREVLRRLLQPFNNYALSFVSTEAFRDGGHNACAVIVPH